MPPAATFRSALSSLRFQSLCRRAHPRGRDDLRVVRFNAVAGAPHFIYPALRHRASARAKALYGAFPTAGGTTSAPSASMPAPFRSALSSLLPQVSAPQPQSQPTVAPIVRSGSTVFHLSSSAPLRLCATTALTGAFPTAGGTTSASSASMPLQEHRISSI